MSKFGTAKEAGDSNFIRKIYTGVENFRVTHVNPTHAELKEMYGENAKEPSYTSEVDITDAEGNVVGKAKNVRIDIYLDNEDEITPIKTRMSFFITKNLVSSNDKTKDKYINAFGRTIWLTPADFEAGKNQPEVSIVGSTGNSYSIDSLGLRKTYRNEDILINFIRNLLNLSSPAKVDKKEDVMSQFEMSDWEAIFNGNFDMLRSIIMSSPNKIGLLLGAKTSDGKVYQDVFVESTVRQYTKFSTRDDKYSFLNREVENVTSNGRYGSTNFGDLSRKLTEYLADAQPTTTANAPQGFGKPAARVAFDSSTATAFSEE